MKQRNQTKPNAGIFVADKANKVLADMVAVTSEKDVERAWRHSIVVSPSVPFILESSPVAVFKGGDNMFGGEKPGLTVLNLGGPSPMVDMTGTKEFSLAVF